MYYNYLSQEKSLQISIQKCSKQWFSEQLKSIQKNFGCAAQPKKSNTNQYFNMEKYECNSVENFVQYQNTNQVHSLNILIQKEANLTQQQFKQLLNDSCGNKYDLFNLHIKIEENQIGKVGAYLLAYQILQLTNLKNLQLEIQNNGIKSKGAQALAYSISQLKNLKTLNLKIDKENKISVPPKQQKKLICNYFSINLFDCLNCEESKYFEQLIDEEIDGIQAIVNMLENHLSLQELDLNIDNDKLSSKYKQGSKNLIQIISNIQSLKKLKLVVGQYFNNNCLLTYPQRRNNQNKLTHLSILIKSYCNINKQGIYTLQNTLLNTPNLSEFSLAIGEKSNIELDSINTLFQALSQLNLLKSLQIQVNWGNSIGIKGAKAISECIQKLQNLKQLRINIDESSNNIDFDGSYLIGCSILSLKQLRSLQAKFFQSQVLKKALMRKQLRLVEQQLE